MNNKLSKLFALITILVACNSADAALVNSDFVSGNNGVGVVNQTNGMQFDLNAGTTNLLWNKFNVGASETVNYNFNAMNSTAFNQINSIGGISKIAGTINAIGLGAATSNIVLNNAAGVSFVNGSAINVGAMTVQSAKNISVQGLRVINGNLDLTTTDGRVDVKGLIFENAGDLAIKATKQVALGGIKNAKNLSAQTNGGIYVKAEDFMVGGEKVSGITADYIDLSSQNGEIRFEGGDVTVNNTMKVATKGGSLNTLGGKITVGKDFMVLTDGHFVDEANAVHTIVTKNGTYYCDGYGANTSKIENTTIVNQDGVLKIFASNLDVNNSTIDNLIVSSGNFTVNNSNITNRLEVGLDGTKNNNTPTKIINSYVHDMEMEYSNLSLDNATIDDLGINGTALSYSNSVVNNNLYFTKYTDRKVSEKITTNEINSLIGLLKDETSNLHLGYTKTMGDNYSANITVNGDMSNSNLFLATKGDVKMDISNLNSLTIENSKNSDITFSGDLKLNNINAQEKITLSANLLNNTISSIGTIDSKINSINLNLGSEYKQIGSGIDENSRVYSIISLGGNTYNVYDGAPYMAPVIIPSTPSTPSVVEPSTPVVEPIAPSAPVETPSTSVQEANNSIANNSTNDTTVSNEHQNYINTLDVNNNEYTLNVTNSQLASQFAKNVKSLAADENEVQNPELTETINGFSIVKSFIPSLKY